ncbi:hypothetical protein T02_5329 [Trichinella nativa]|uniref:Uncharacterized protein n=2 Tax=Trichinella TaxID=6333 RepID=A0A0V1LT76_9BILA|nr:hypothetical protein T12_16993 [Trichinella patagoniensis]KRZ62604.1 hypothetical protein T02_5329 [Trichinella nativa]KRZ84664.1 hypothetical protein T08_15996 [Trichinella sp. T8]
MLKNYENIYCLQLGWPETQSQWRQGQPFLLTDSRPADQPQATKRQAERDVDNDDDD